ncbi:MAG TPA: ABC transporter ATP-binding protein, partial [Thiomicrospira sp.]|nr:ABC transporter ATP-binding protein [Thiomicrospira sp.]
MSESTVLSVKNLVLNIEENRLIDDISFEIKAAEIFALVGESGSGKSLTSLAIMRLLPEVINVNSGSIVLQDQNLFKVPEYQMQKVRGKQVAMIFQEPMTSLNPGMKVGDQVAEVLKLHLG